MSSTTLPGPVPASSPRKLPAWLPTIAWLCILAAFSTDAFSADHTARILLKIIHVFYGPIPHHQFEHIHFLVRKAAHFLSYGFLSALAFFSWRATFPVVERWSFRWAALGILTAFAGGSLDELHQTFVPSRTSNFHDVLIDTAGALFFQIVIALWIIFKERRTNWKLNFS